jgi:uncharacterized protein (DUF433 family)
MTPRKEGFPLAIPVSNTLWLILKPVEAVVASPRGHYLAAEVGQLAGVSGKRIGQWARRGYIRSSWYKTIPRVYSYQDVAEAMVVHELEDRGVLPQVIGTVVSDLRERLGTEWPLQGADLMVPKTHPRARGRGKTIALREKGRIEDLYRRHPVLAEMDLVEIAKHLARGGWAARDLPNLQYIEVNPDRLSGRPTIKGRRVAAKDVAQTAASAAGRRTLREGYDLTTAEIRDARRWWGKVQAYEAAA